MTSGAGVAPNASLAARAAHSRVASLAARAAHSRVASSASGAGTPSDTALAARASRASSAALTARTRLVAATRKEQSGTNQAGEPAYPRGRRHQQISSTVQDITGAPVSIQGKHYRSALEQPAGKALPLPRPPDPSYLDKAEPRDLPGPAAILAPLRIAALLNLGLLT